MSLNWLWYNYYYIILYAIGAQRQNSSLKLFDHFIFVADVVVVVVCPNNQPTPLLVLFKSEQTVEQRNELPVKWDAQTRMWRQCNEFVPEGAIDNN